MLVSASPIRKSQAPRTDVLRTADDNPYQLMGIPIRQRSEIVRAKDNVPGYSGA